MMAIDSVCVRVLLLSACNADSIAMLQTFCIEAKGQSNATVHADDPAAVADAVDHNSGAAPFRAAPQRHEGEINHLPPRPALSHKFNFLVIVLGIM